MEGHPERCQWLESSLYVDFGATSDTEMQILEVQASKSLDEIKNFFSWSWHT